MRKLVLKMSVSLDGFVSGPNGEVDWIFKSDDGATEWVVDALWQAGIHAMGSRTYYDMATYWPTSDLPFAAPMNEIPKVVFTRKGLALTDAKRAEIAASGASQAVKDSWAKPRIASGDLAAEMARLKAEPGKDIIAHGGAGFARELAAHGLIDEYKLLVHSVALGKGLAVFSGLTKPVDLQLVNAWTFGGGAVALHYRAA
jgi:dihydrofolate reductase